jgi:hypothetical protein
LFDLFRKVKKGRGKKKRKMMPRVKNKIYSWKNNQFWVTLLFRILGYSDKKKNIPGVHFGDMFPVAKKVEILRPRSGIFARTALKASKLRGSSSSLAFVRL